LQRIHTEHDAMKLIILTKPNFFVEEDKILETLFEEGLESLHLCKPNTSPLYSERLLSLLPNENYKKIFVHHHYYLKNEYSLGGIHIDDEKEEKPKGYHGKVGRTCHNLADLKATKKQSDFVFLGNIFASETNNATFTQDELKQASKKGLIDKHVYAAGGVTIDNISIAKDLGFGGVVVCDDLWNRFDIHQENDFKELLSYFEKIRKATN